MHRWRFGLVVTSLGLPVKLSLSGVSTQRNALYARNVRNVTKWRHYWTGQSQPPATTAYAAGMLPSCGRHAVKYEIIEIKFDLHHKLHNK